MIKPFKGIVRGIASSEADWRCRRVDRFACNPATKFDTSQHIVEAAMSRPALSSLLERS